MGKGARNRDLRRRAGALTVGESAMVTRLTYKWAKRTLKRLRRDGAIPVRR